MKNRIGKKYITTITLITTIIAILIASSVTIHALDAVDVTESYEKQEYLLNLLAPDDKAYNIISEKPIYNASGQAIYRYYELHPVGYAIYNTLTGNYEEISFYSRNCPFSANTTNKGYYFGPGNYLALDSMGNFRDLYDNSLVLDENLSLMFELEANKLAVENELLSTQDVRSTYASNVVNPRTTTCVEVNISHSNYFTSLLNESFFENTDGTCTVVAAQILLSYYDYYIDVDFVPTQYHSGFGSTDAFHNLLLDYCCPNNSYNGDGVSLQILPNALNTYFEDVGITSYEAYNVIGTSLGVRNSANSQISDYDVPLIGAMFETRGANMNHSVVIYGHQTIYEDGVMSGIYYNVHTGWYGTTLGTYNHSWFADCVYIEEVN